MTKGREYDIDTLSADGAQESPPTRLPASEGTIPPGSDGPFAMTRQPGSTSHTSGLSLDDETWRVRFSDSQREDAAMGDPVATLQMAMTLAMGPAADPSVEHEQAVRLRLTLAEQGYVLVNAEGLAAALRGCPPFDPYQPGWEKAVAAAILAAIQEQQP